MPLKCSLRGREVTLKTGPSRGAAPVRSWSHRVAGSMCGVWAEKFTSFLNSHPGKRNKIKQNKTVIFRYGASWAVYRLYKMNMCFCFVFSDKYHLHQYNLKLSITPLKLCQFLSRSAVCVLFFVLFGVFSTFFGFFFSVLLFLLKLRF